MSLISLVLRLIRGKHILIPAIAIAAGYATAAKADDSQICVPVGGTHMFYANNIETKITDVDKDTPGTIIKDAASFNLGGTYSTTGCGNRSPAYITTTSPLPVIGDNSEGGKWYQVNEYLGLAMQGWVAGNVNKYFHVPFISKSNQYNTNTQNNWESGSKGKVSIQILKSFIGFSAFSKVIMQTQISRNPNTGASGPFVSQLVMSGQVIVPQNCEIDGGTTVAMNFGNIGASAFSQAGAGNKPAGVNPQTHTIGIKCKNIDAQALLSLRLEATTVSGNAMVSDNTDIGFIVADKDKKPLTPNNINSTIPFTLDDNASYSLPITAWPVSVTGNKPAEGVFTAEGYLRVDFQ